MKHAKRNPPEFRYDSIIPVKLKLRSEHSERGQLTHKNPTFRSRTAFRIVGFSFRLPDISLREIWHSEFDYCECRDRLEFFGDRPPMCEIFRPKRERLMQPSVSKLFSNVSHQGCCYIRRTNTFLLVAEYKLCVVIAYRESCFFKGVFKSNIRFNTASKTHRGGRILPDKQVDNP